MNMQAWSQYVSMDDSGYAPGRLDAVVEGLQDWDDDFELGEVWSDEPVEFDEDAE